MPVMSVSQEEQTIGEGDAEIPGVGLGEVPEPFFATPNGTVAFAGPKGPEVGVATPSEEEGNEQYCSVWAEAIFTHLQNPAKYGTVEALAEKMRRSSAGFYIAFSLLKPQDVLSFAILDTKRDDHALVFEEFGVTRPKEERRAPYEYIRAAGAIMKLLLDTDSPHFDTNRPVRVQMYTHDSRDPFFLRSEFGLADVASTRKGPLLGAAAGDIELKLYNYFFNINRA